MSKPLMDIPDAFVESQHNKIKAFLPSGITLVLERYRTSIDTYCWTLHIRKAGEKHYASSDFTRFIAVEDQLGEYGITRSSLVWLSIEETS